MKNTVKLNIIIFIIILSGCSTYKPNFYQGHYYMTGDSDCKSYVRFFKKDTKILCYNSDGEPQGYRNAMTDQQLQMYQFEKQEHSKALKNLANTISKVAEKSRANIPKTTYTSCYRQFGNRISCTSF